MKKPDKLEHLDLEWIRLIKEAKIIGLSLEEIRTFLLREKETP